MTTLISKQFRYGRWGYRPAQWFRRMHWRAQRTIDYRWRVPRLIRHTRDWYAANPKRWNRGSYFGLEGVSIIALSNDEQKAIADLERRQGAHPAEDSRFWGTVLDLQQKDHLSACLMGGFQKFAWEYLGKPDMGDTKNASRVGLLADRAALAVWQAREPVSTRDLTARMADPREEMELVSGAHARVTSINDSQLDGYDAMIELLTKAGGR